MELRARDVLSGDCRVNESSFAYRACWRTAVGLGLTHDLLTIAVCSFVPRWAGWHSDLQRHRPGRGRAGRAHRIGRRERGQVVGVKMGLCFAFPFP